MIAARTWVRYGTSLKSMKCDHCGEVEREYSIVEMPDGKRVAMVAHLCFVDENENGKGTEK